VGLGVGRWGWESVLQYFQNGGLCKFSSCFSHRAGLLGLFRRADTFKGFESLDAQKLTVEREERCIIEEISSEDLQNFRLWEVCGEKREDEGALRTLPTPAIGLKSHVSFLLSSCDLPVCVAARETLKILRVLHEFSHNFQFGHVSEGVFVAQVFVHIGLDIAVERICELRAFAPLMVDGFSQVLHIALVGTLFIAHDDGVEPCCFRNDDCKAGEQSGDGDVPVQSTLLVQRKKLCRKTSFDGNARESCDADELIDERVTADAQKRDVFFLCLQFLDRHDGIFASADGDQYSLAR